MKKYKLTERKSKTNRNSQNIYNGLKKIATITECKISHIGEWEVILYPSSLGFWFPSEEISKEFLRKSEEDYLSCLGSDVQIVWKNS